MCRISICVYICESEFVQRGFLRGQHKCKGRGTLGSVMLSVKQKFAVNHWLDSLVVFVYVVGWVTLY